MKNAITILLIISALTLASIALIYDPKGRFEGTCRQDDDSRMKIYDRKGRYQGYIEDHRVYNRDGTLEHRIVPDKTNKKK